MIQKFSYHTHTNFSDGSFPLSRMLEKAVELGWREIGVTDHLIIHENMNNSPVKKYFAERLNHFCFDNFNTAYEVISRNIESIRKQISQYSLKVYVGFEVDFFTYDGWLDRFLKLKECLDIDYLISGNHFLFDDSCQTLIHRKYLPQFVADEKEQNKWIARHFNTIARAADSGLFAFLAHIDSLKRSPECGEWGFQEERRQIIKALQDSHTACEVNTKGLCEGYGLYPSPWMLKEMCAAKIPVLISDDAHQPEKLGCGFEIAETTLANLNYKYRFQFGK